MKEGGVGKYLGLPEHFGRRKRGLFSSIVDRIRQRALNWSSKFLSPAGKLTMLKSVLSAMPTYTMSCFKIPASLSKRIQSVFTRFWWDTNTGKKCMDWIAWSKLTRSKKNGGLGFRDVQSFNDALLAKLSWRLLNNPNSLLARTLMGKYCKNADLMKCRAPISSSHGWRGILIGRDLLAQQLGWAIGNGKSIRVWQDKWLPSLDKAAPMGPAIEKAAELRVEDLFIPSTTDWDRDKLHRLIPQAEQEIMMLKPSIKDQPDKRIWLKQKSGIYTTKSGYHTIRNEGIPLVGLTSEEPIQWNTDIWTIKTSPKIQMFLWKAAHGALPTGERLASRQIAIDPACRRCGELETITHLMFHCVFAQQVWKSAPFVTRVDPISYNCFVSGWKSIKALNCLPPVGILQDPLAPWICWALWKERNNLVFNDRSYTVTETLAKAVVDAKEWMNAQTKGDLTREKNQIQIHRLNNTCMQADLVTCRSDGAWKKGTPAAGLGWVFLRPDQTLISAHSQATPFVNSPLMAEALALREAMDSALRLGFYRIVFESDSMTLVKALSAKEMIAEIYGTLADISFIASSFESICFKFISRTFNSLADDEAKKALAVFVENL